MKPTLIFFLSLVTSVAVQAAEFQPLFDGETLKGWTGDAANWSVIGGAIVGSSMPDGRKTNTFLIADGDHKDFVLRLKFKGGDGGSGIQFRSRPLGEKAIGVDGEYRVTGYQADIGGADLGTFYEEKGRGTIVKSNYAKLKPHLKQDDWNTYQISAIGNQYELKINGHVTATYTDKADDAVKSGLIALQLQAGKGMIVQFKEIEIKTINLRSQPKS